MDVKKSNANNNIYTKNLNKVEQYLVKVFQQYLSGTSDIDEKSINSIINEAIKRFKKEFQLSQQSFAVTSINNMKGDVKLTANNIGAEPEIKIKRGSFNKDFGTEKGTVCEGNDIRLSDAREPKKHSHGDEYIRKEDVEKYIVSFLRKNGISIEDKNNVFAKDVILQNVIIREE